MRETRDRQTQKQPTRSTQQQRRQKPKSAAAAQPSLAGTKLNAILAIALALATIAIYSPVFSHPFLVLDDHDYVTANPHVHNGISWPTIQWALTATEAANWHPLTWISHALDYQFFALNPAGHHFDNVLLHAMNAALLFLVLQWITKRTGPSLLVAAVFAFHPINVESVAWIAERKNVLSTFFLILTIAAYAWYAQKPAWRRYLLFASLFAAGLMAKPMLVTLPLCLLLLDFWPLQRASVPSFGRGQTSSAFAAAPVSFRQLLLEKLPLLVLSAASSWMTLRAQHTVVRTFQDFTLATRIENALIAYALYLWKTIWPAHLAFYPHSIYPLPAWQWILAALILTAITAFVVIFRRHRYLPVGWLWFLITLVPVIGLVQVGEQAMADRYAYVPLIGIFIMLAWGVADLAQARQVATGWISIAAVAAIVILAVLTVIQTSYWESDYDLWSHTLATSETPFVHNALAVALMNPESEMSAADIDSVGSAQDRLDQAQHHLERALELRLPLAEKNPYTSRWDMARTLNNLGNLDRLQNRLDQARQHDEAALTIYRQLAQENPAAYLPYLASILNNLGAMDRLQNRTDEGRQSYEQALQIDRQLAAQDPAKYLPNTAMTLNEFGLLDEAQNHFQDGSQHFQEALAIERGLVAQSPQAYTPQLAMTLENFATLNAVQGNMEEARRHFDEALTIERQLAQSNPAVYLPDIAMTLSNLGRVDGIENKPDQARAHYQEALSLLQKLAPQDSRYANGVSSIQAALRQLDASPAPRRAVQ